MKKLTALLLIAVITVVAWNCDSPKTMGATDSGIYNSFCDSSSPNNLCSFIPYDVNETFGVGYDSFLDSAHQTPFDVFSWQTFVALNWPADRSGNPVGSITDKPDMPRVWEFYSDPAEVFGHPDAGLVAQLGMAKSGGQKFFYMDSKSPLRLAKGTVVDMNKVNARLLQGFKEADGHPLIDRNLNFALYEIKMNPVETNFIIKNGLTTQQGIYNYVTGLDSSSHALKLPQSDSASRNVGSMEVKASWRILVPALGDDTSRYYCRRAVIYIDAGHTRNHRPLILTNVQVGLVGMHIIRKTAKMSSAEIWTTFEHIDNTPDNPQEAQQSGRRWSFYNPQCLNCTPNVAPDTLAGDNGQYLWEPTMPYGVRYATNAPGQQFGHGFGTQAVRTYPVYKFTEMTNRLWQQKLQGTVWANYRLIGSQWQLAEVHPQPMAPNFLANTTLETYIQNDASCISCHSFASISFNGDSISTDLSFIFPVYAQDSIRKVVNAMKK